MRISEVGVTKEVAFVLMHVINQVGPRQGEQIGCMLCDRSVVNA